MGSRQHLRAPRLCSQARNGTEDMQRIHRSGCNGERCIAAYRDYNLLPRDGPAHGKRKATAGEARPPPGKKVAVHSISEQEGGEYRRAKSIKSGFNLETAACVSTIGLDGASLIGTSVPSGVHLLPKISATPVKAASGSPVGLSRATWTKTHMPLSP